MNIVWRLLGGLALLLSFGVLTAWAWDKSDALNNNNGIKLAAPTAAAAEMIKASSDTSAH